MRRDKIKALQLRRRGKSYNEISRVLGVPKSTLSDWLHMVRLSAPAKQRIAKLVTRGSLRGLLKRNHNQTRLAIQRMHQARLRGRNEIKKITKHDLKLLGVSLYWAEGYKRATVVAGRERTHHPVALTNSDPQLIAIYLRFLREVCLVPDSSIHADIRIFKHMDRYRSMRFWRRVTRLPAKNFGKVYYGVSISSRGKRPFNRLPFGTILIRVNNTSLFHTIMGWLSGVARFSRQ